MIANPFSNRFHPSAQAMAAALALALSACGGSTTEPEDPEIDAGPILSDIAYKVILPTYQNLNAKADLLAEAVSEFGESRSEADLEAAKQSWIAARRPWEQSEAFLFGPVSLQGIDPSIDSWPVNKTDLDGVLSGNTALTKAYIDAQEGSLKGFHTMEYLLFGQENDKSAGEFTDREIEYLAAVTLSFKGAVAQLESSWDPGQGNYADTLAKAGSGSRTYASQKSALEELVNGMIGICDEVANGKIADPFSQGRRSLEESQFSDNSNLDFADNIRSVENLYLGRYGTGSGNGISALIEERDADLDALVKSEIESAISAIGEMTPTFGDAITNNKGKVEAAQEAIQKLQETLESRILPLVSN